MKIFEKKEFDNRRVLDKHIIFICDHASNKIPKKFNNLGLSKDKLRSHIGWDIGAKKIALMLAEKLNQSIFMSNYSRLLIDLNRNKKSPDLIIPRSFGIDIPMNKELNFSQKKIRIQKYYDPYHYELKTFVLKKKKQYEKVSLVSIHSFTKNGILFDRGPRLGLLHGKNVNLLLFLRKYLIRKNIHFGINYPYSGYLYNFTLDRASQHGKHDNLCIEIRNDLICCEKGIRNYSRILGKIFWDVLNER